VITRGGGRHAKCANVRAGSNEKTDAEFKKSGRRYLNLFKDFLDKKKEATLGRGQNGPREKLRRGEERGKCWGKDMAGGGLTSGVGR